MAILNEELDSVLLARDNIKTAIINKGQTVGNDLRTYANAIDSISDLPDGIFIKENQPVKDTSEALWLQNVNKSKASQKIAIEYTDSGWYTSSRSVSCGSSANWTWGDILSFMSEEQILLFDSYSYHILIHESYNFSDYITLVASDTMYKPTSGNILITSGSTIVVRCNNAFSGGTKTATITTPDGYSLERSYKIFAWENIYIQGSSTIGYSSDVVDSEDGLEIDINANTKYLVYMNKTNTWNKILDTANANATASDILNTKTAFVNNRKITGTMPNNGVINITPSTTQQTIPAGYTSGGTVAAVDNTIDENITQANIRAGVTILGIEGNLEPDKPDQTKTVTPSTSQQVIEPDIGYELASVTVNPVTASIDSNIIPENIKKDVTILGVTGTHEGGGSVNYNIYIQQTEPENKQGIWINAPTQSYTIQEINSFNTDYNYGANKLLIVRGTDISTQIIDGITYYFYSCVLTDSEGNNKLEYHKYRGTGNSWIEIEDDFAVLTPEEAIESNSILDSILGQSDQGDTDNLTPEEDIIANQIADDILGNN